MLFVTHNSSDADCLPLVHFFQDVDIRCPGTLNIESHCGDQDIGPCFYQIDISISDTCPSNCTSFDIFIKHGFKVLLYTLSPTFFKKVTLFIPYKNNLIKDVGFYIPLKTSIYSECNCQLTFDHFIVPRMQEPHQLFVNYTNQDSYNHSFSKFFKYNKRKFILFLNTILTWETAEMECSYNGGSLWSIESEEEMNHMVNFVHHMWLDSERLMANLVIYIGLKSLKEVSNIVLWYLQNIFNYFTFFTMFI